MGGTELLIALLCWVDWLPHVAKVMRGEIIKLVERRAS